MRVFALSDVHVDYAVNAQWLRDISASGFQDDVLILAGDLSDRQARICETFSLVSQKFKHVFFVPGNHDLWVKQRENKTSLEKFYEVQALAESFGIKTQAQRIGDIIFLPLLSWYDFSFGQPSDFIKKAWMDFSRCVWPDELSDVGAVTRFFHEENKKNLEAVLRWQKIGEQTSSANLIAQDIPGKVISFSHFLPRIDVMPARIPLDKRDIYPVLGSESLDAQLRLAGAAVHIYGHSHVNRCVEIDGVHYINNAYAYPSEVHLARKYLVDVFDLVDQTRGA